MTDRVCVVTGANSGIGKMTAVGLAEAGATVVMACRDLARRSAALAEVRVLSGSGKVQVMQLDLASQASVRAFVEAFTQRFDRLDVLVNNAGVASPTRKLTADGFELHFGVHHLGSFLLTTLLLPVLERRPRHHHDRHHPGTARPSARTDEAPVQAPEERCAHPCLSGHLAGGGRSDGQVQLGVSVTFETGERPVRQLGDEVAGPQLATVGVAGELEVDAVTQRRG